MSDVDGLEVVAWQLGCQTMGGDIGYKLSWSQSGAGVCTRLQGEEYEHPLCRLSDARALIDQQAQRIAELEAQIADPEYPPKYARRLIAELREQIAELEAHCLRLGQGDAERYWDGRWRDADAELTALKADAEKWRRGSALRYEQNQELHGLVAELRAELEAAPAKVVMPERIKRPTRLDDDYRDGWNGCLDEVARLNTPAPQPPVQVYQCPRCATSLQVDPTAKPYKAPTTLAGWRPVPIENLTNILRLLDPEPVRLPDGQTMVFVNPHAAEVLTRLSAEVRAMLAAAPKPSDDAKDAARYRWLIDNAGLAHWESMLEFADIAHLTDIDECIDAAMGSKGDE